MQCACVLVTLIMLLCCVSLSHACYCDHYPWSSWSVCTATCNHGTQERSRSITYNDYFWKNSCDKLCNRHEMRACNVEACPISCRLTDFGPWSGCSPCAKKQFRTRELERPAQFGGVQCYEPLQEERNCHPSQECVMEELDCGKKMKCDNGRCINPALKCNSQNDCGDNSDEKMCGNTRKVCNRVYPRVPGADLMARGFDAAAERERTAAVLDNNFLGDKCVTNRSGEDRIYYRIPANLETVELKVENLEDYKNHIEPVQSQKVEFASQGSGSSGHSYSTDNSFFVPIIVSWTSKHSMRGSSSFTTAVRAAQEKDSQFIRVHQLLAVSYFRTKSSDLQLSEPFLRTLNNLPLDYSYALYRQVFQEFGTHYFGSGTLGGHYDLLYQYDREELKNSGLTEAQANTCASSEAGIETIFYGSSSKYSYCEKNRMSEKYEGSFIRSSERSISMVRGGVSEYAAALGMERKGTQADSTIYKDWIESIKDNPAIVDYELLPILPLVRDIPCAVTKRRHLQRALLEYLHTFDSCKCAPCPNNARPVLVGTQCQCVCQTGTYGDNCEKRAQDLTSETVDGRWSCWSSWSDCDGSMKRHRVRECNNPAPLRGGQSCQGNNRQEDECYISIFQKQDVCINDDETKPEGEDDPEPDSQSCVRPRPPPNGYLRINKKRFRFGEREEIICFTGYEMSGYQYIQCRTDGTWSETKAECLKQVCPRPVLPNQLLLTPLKAEYSVGDSVTLSCSVPYMSPTAGRFYTCGKDLSWKPPVPSDIHCKNEQEYVPDSSCGWGRRLVASQCVCIAKEECVSFPETLCILDAAAGVSVLMSICKFHADVCHGEKLFFLQEAPCPTDAASLDWPKLRAKLSVRSLTQQPCGHDTCYEWESCSAGSQRCECKLPRNCPHDAEVAFCVEMLKTQSRKSLSVCGAAAVKCAGMDFKILQEKAC